MSQFVISNSIFENLKTKVMSKPTIITEDTAINKIYIIRGKKVMIDRDLAEMYGIETRL